MYSTVSLVLGHDVRFFFFVMLEIESRVSCTQHKILCVHFIISQRFAIKLVEIYPNPLIILLVGLCHNKMYKMLFI